jgi:mono/diheme cytochrome c family protein
VLAALASSDLEYPGIMRPREMDTKPPPPRPYETWERDRDLGYGPPQPPRRESQASAVKEEEPPKKRRRKGGAGNTDIPEDAEVEYADPDGDTTRGPVFVHPPKGAVQACVRCHRIKRKCDGAFPRCASCTRADVPCVFELSAATST